MVLIHFFEGVTRLATYTMISPGGVERDLAHIALQYTSFNCLMYNVRAAAKQRKSIVMCVVIILPGLRRSYSVLEPCAHAFNALF